MSNWIYDRLEEAFELVALLGFPLAVAAWLTVFLGSIGLFRVVRRYDWRRHRRALILFGLITMGGYVADITATLVVSPHLELEGNPIWLLVLERWGLGPALVYGFSGKLLLAVCTVEAFAFWLVQRHALYPESATGFREFWSRLGNHLPAYAGVRPARLFNFFAYAFALIAPFSYYIALLNAFARSDLYLLFPPMPLAVAAWLAGVAALYPWVMWRSFRAERS